MGELKVGDKVKILAYNRLSCPVYMGRPRPVNNLIGQETFITEKHEMRNVYRIHVSDSRWWYAKNWLEKIKD